MRDRCWAEGRILSADCTAQTSCGFLDRVASHETVVYAGITNRDFPVAWSRDYGNHARFVAQIEKDVRSRPYPLTDALVVIAREGVRPATAIERRGG